MEFINETRCNERTVLAMNRASIRQPTGGAVCPSAAGGACGVFLLRRPHGSGFPSLVDLSRTDGRRAVAVGAVFKPHPRLDRDRLVLKGEQLAPGRI